MCVEMKYKLLQERRNKRRKPYPRTHPAGKTVNVTVLTWRVVNKYKDNKRHLRRQSEFAKMIGQMNVERFEYIANQTRQWYVDIKSLVDMYKYIHSHMFSTENRMTFMDVEIGYAKYSLGEVKLFSGEVNRILKDGLPKLKVIDLARSTIIPLDEVVTFIENLYLISLFDVTDNYTKNQDKYRLQHEKVCRGKVNEVKMMFDAKEELSRVVTSDVDTILPGFRMIYQVTNDDDLSRFNILIHDSQSHSTYYNF